MSEQPRTEGQRLLLAGPKASEVVKRTGLAKGAVSEFRAGKKVPGEAARKKLSVLGIPPSSWDIAASPNRARERARPAPAPEPEPPPEPEAPEFDEPASSAKSTLEEMEAHTRRIAASLREGALSEAETTKRMNSYTAALRALGQLEQDEELREGRIVLEHPGFKKVMGEVFRILKPHPELTKQIAAALRELEPPPEPRAPS